MTDDLPVPVERLVHVVSAVFALVFALVLASLITQLVTSLALRAGVVADDTNAFTLLQTVVSFASFLPGVAG
jgi:hypothetical protein